MQLIERIVPDDFNVFLIGDSHVGSKMHHWEGWNEMVNMATSAFRGVDHNVIVDHGDTIEAIQTDDPRFQLDTTKQAEILAQVEQARRDRFAICDQMVVILEGNHERKYHRFGPIVEKLICNELKVPYGTYSCIITYKDKDGAELFKHYATHGAGSISSVADDEIRVESNMQLSLKRKLKKKAGDAALMSMGHTHKLLIAKPKKLLSLTSDGYKIKQNYISDVGSDSWIHPDHRWYVNTGSFLKLYGEMGQSGYAEVAGYDPVLLGFAVATVRDRRITDVVKVLI